ncbi:hypothetical protein NMY22_g19340 [Coprinellus aureogranulatus]|nr:hypothetical protein NMY22_g19340 [Coprinellus aureogranulatus]
MVSFTKSHKPGQAKSKHYGMEWHRTGYRPTVHEFTAEVPTEATRQPAPSTTNADGDYQQGQHWDEDEPRAEGSKTKSQIDYLHEFMDKYKDRFIAAILEREAPAGQRRMRRRAAKPTVHGRMHARDPFHRVQTWTGTHFSPNWLWAAGVRIYLGHRGAPCPNMKPDEPDGAFENLPTDGPAGHTSHDFTYGAQPLGKTLQGHRVVTIVHSNGLHSLPVVICGCPEREHLLLEDFLALGLFPASFDDVQTVFTFAVLEDCLMDFLECHTAPSKYFNKLRRLTNPAFPDTVPTRIVELHRAKRSFLHIKELMTFGFANSGLKPGPGQLAYFCAMCPQRGINLHPAADNDPQRWKYARGFAGDGNFVNVHQAMLTIEPDVQIKDGEGFLANSQDFKKCEQHAFKVNQRADCNEHRALDDKSKIHKGCDITGIGACTCLRHGAFVPASVVNFKAGEKQSDMDYSFDKTCKYGDFTRVPLVAFVYDVGCQWGVYHSLRVDKNPYLDLPKETPIVYAIGTWHVHGHKAQCYPRYSLMFVPGVGWKSGEILEARWSVTNPGAFSLRYMTLEHRGEMLDAIMNDVNFKTMVGGPVYIVSSYERAVKESRAAEQEFERINGSCKKSQTILWRKAEEEAQRNRFINIAAMDIYSSTVDKGKYLPFSK